MPVPEALPGSCLRPAIILLLAIGLLRASEPTGATATASGAAWFAAAIPTRGPILCDIGALIGHRPAGAFGPLLRVGDHFELAQRPGEPFRLFGANLDHLSGIPPADQAEGIAAHLAAIGFNAVRFHHIFSDLVDNKRDDLQHLRPEMLDRLDRFAAALKAHGIYLDLSLLTWRWTFKPGDGVVDGPALTPRDKIVNFYDPAAIALQERFAREMLQRVNPYTGLRWGEDPALAAVEIINEASFFGSGETGADGRLPPGQAAQLDRLFNAFLRLRYADREALASAWNDLAADEDPIQGTVRRSGLYPRDAKLPSTPRMRDLARCYAGIEAAYYQRMTRIIRSCGFRGPVNGSNNYYGLLPLWSQRESCDYTDVHGYFGHPIYGPQGRPGVDNFTTVQFLAANIPEGFEPTYGLRWPNILPTHKWALGGIAGMPLVSSEWNAPPPHRSQHEAALLTAAYGAFQGLSALYVYTYNDVQAASRQPFFDLPPAVQAQIPAAALAYRRGDVTSARTTVVLPFTEDEAIDLQLAPGLREQRFRFLPGAQDLPLAACLVHGIRRSFVDQADPGRDQRAAGVAAGLANPYCSDTGELTWDHGGHREGRVLVDTPRFQGIDYAGGDERRFALRDLAITTSATAAIHLVSLDGEPLVRSKSMLLTVVGESHLTGQAMTADGTSTTAFGTLPVLFHPVPATLALAGDRPIVTPVDGRGGGGTPLPVTMMADGAWTWQVGASATLWYRVTR